MDTLYQLKLSMKRSAVVGVKNFAMLAAPIIVASLCFEALLHGLHTVIPGKHLVLDPVLVMGVCFPLGLAAEGVLATLYLNLGTSKGKQFQHAADFLRKRRLALTIGKLICLTLLWLVVGLVIVCLLALLVLIAAIVFRSLAHPGVKPHAPRLGRSFVWAWFALYAYLASRYSFVLPRFAMEHTAGENSWDHAVARAKAHLPGLGVFCAVEFVTVLILSWVILHAGRPAHESSTALTFVNVIVCGFVSAYFETVKVDLARADADWLAGKTAPLAGV